MLSGKSIASKRKNSTSQNLLFQSWLTKAMNDAFTRELKSYHAYKKALSSLKKYPLVLRSGKECRILEGFGSKLCDMLDEKLAKYAEELGVTPSEALILGNSSCSSNDPAVANHINQHPASSLTRSSSDKQVVTAAPARLDTTPSTTDHSDTTQPSFQLHQPASTECDLQTLTDNRTHLLNMLHTSKNPNGCSLHELAACLRSSYLNTSTVSVLASLNQLIDAGQVVKSGGFPERYRLNSSSSVHSGHCSTTLQLAAEATNVGSSLHICSNVELDKVDPANEVLSLNDHPSTVNEYPLKFFYADETCQARTRRTQAHVKRFTADDEVTELCGFRILCSYEELIISGLSYRLDWSGSSTDSVFSTVAYLLDPEAPSICTGSVQATDETPPLTVSPIAPQVTSDGPPNKRCCATLIPANSPIPVLQRTTSEGSTLLSAARIPGQVSTNLPEARPISQPVSPNRARSQVGFFNRVLSSSSENGLVIPGGTYELLLICDVREHFGLNKVRQLLPSVLQSLGVQCEARALPVGDFLWIIRWRDEKDGMKEAVLDYVVERKRADDLAHSITDGRFQEQKYRMKRTQISNRIFLIEECPSMRNQRIPFETLVQAVSNSQIIDGFQLMWTRSPEDTVDWLAAITNHLHDRSSLDVYISLVPAGPEQENMLRARMWLDYVQLAQKSPAPTVRDMFAKQLLQIHGFSGSKVAAVLQRYPTPHRLLKAYDALKTNHEKENMLAYLKLPGTNRTLGSALSRRVHLAYNTP